MKILRVRALIEVELTRVVDNPDAPDTEFTVSQAAQIVNTWTAGMNVADGGSVVKIVGQPFLRVAYVRDES